MDQYPAQVAPTKSNTGLIVGLILGGVALFCIAPFLLIIVCLAAISMLGQNASMTFTTVGASLGSTVGNLTPSQQEAKFVVEDFLDDLTLNDIDAAHRQFSASLRQTMGKAQLRTLVGGFPGLTKDDSKSDVTEDFAGAGPGRRRYNAIVRAGNLTHRVTVDVVSENGDPKIDSFEVRDGAR